MQDFVRRVLDVDKNTRFFPLPLVVYVGQNNTTTQKLARLRITKNDEITIKLVRDEKVRISKTDVTGDKEIPGASLVLTDESGKEVASWKSGSKKA